jgi:hypothetical protein
MKNIKHWLQIAGGSLMIAAILGGHRGVYYEWNPKMFLAGALIFLSTFIIWRRKENDDDLD